MKNFNVITMPGGEQHVTYAGHETLNISTPRKTIRVEGIVTAKKLIAIGMACEVYDRNTSASPDLVLPYIPGGRQDRTDIPEVGFSLKVYASIIGTFPINRLITLDPHSTATGVYLAYSNLNKSIHVLSHQDWFLPWIEKQTFAPRLHKFLFPDKGAEAKYSVVSAYSPARSCKKIRDPKTGKLSGFEVPNLKDWEDNFIWIVDDICDGGGTFVAIAEQVRKQLHNKCKLGLTVSHGIFSNQYKLTELAKLFDYIVTTDSVFEGFKNLNVYNAHLLDTGKLQVQPLSPILRGMGINA